jgi:hypothetical protein
MMGYDHERRVYSLICPCCGEPIEVAGGIHDDAIERAIDKAVADTKVREWAKSTGRVRE